MVTVDTEVVIEDVRDIFPEDVVYDTIITTFKLDTILLPVFDDPALDRKSVV